MSGCSFSPPRSVIRSSIKCNWDTPLAEIADMMGIGEIEIVGASEVPKRDRRMLGGFTILVRSTYKYPPRRGGHWLPPISLSDEYLSAALIPF